MPRKLLSDHRTFFKYFFNFRPLKIYEKISFFLRIYLIIAVYRRISYRSISAVPAQNSAFEATFVAVVQIRHRDNRSGSVAKYL